MAVFFRDSRIDTAISGYCAALIIADHEAEHSGENESGGFNEY